MKFFYLLIGIFLPCFVWAQDTTIIITADTVFCGDADIVFQQRCEAVHDSISFVQVHENETTASAAANLLLDSVHHSCFVTWKSQQQRFINFTLNGMQYRFDPNRIYTLTGIKATLKDNGAYSTAAALQVRNVAEVFKEKYVISYSLVVALHNNTNSGGLSINSYKKGAVYAKDAKAVFANPKQDADDFFYTTELAYFNFLKKKGYNVVLQNNKTVKDDGSLSVFCGSQQIPYINVEAEEGHLQQQIKMLHVVQELIEQFNLSGIKKLPDTANYK